MRIEDQRGWIILNYEIPVFPTLRTTRKLCIRHFCRERELPGLERGKEWGKAVRCGQYKCVKIQLVFD